MMVDPRQWGKRRILKGTAPAERAMAATLENLNGGDDKHFVLAPGAVVQTVYLQLPAGRRRATCGGAA
jgi:hypothetical protein